MNFFEKVFLSFLVSIGFYLVLIVSILGASPITVMISYVLGDIPSLKEETALEISWTIGLCIFLILVEVGARTNVRSKAQEKLKVECRQRMMKYHNPVQIETPKTSEEDLVLYRLSESSEYITCEKADTIAYTRAMMIAILVCQGISLFFEINKSICFILIFSIFFYFLRVNTQN